MQLSLPLCNHQALDTSTPEEISLHARMSAHDSFMPVFEAFTSNTADGMNESADDSEGDEAGETSTAAEKRQNAKSSLPDAEVGDKRKRARGKGKRKIAIGKP